MITEEIHLNLVHKGAKKAENSMHLEIFPDVSSINDDKALVAKMDRVRDICSTALAVRNNENIRTRQPLARLVVQGKGFTPLESFAALIADELNVKQIQFSDQIEDSATLKLKINFPLLGKRLPRKIKDIIAANKQGKWKKRDDGKIEITGEVLNSDECELLLEPKDKKGAQALSSNDALVILDLDITEELANEGIARDLVRLIQQARKEADLHVADRVNLKIECSQSLQSSVSAFVSYINEQTLAIIEFGNPASYRYRFTEKLEGEEIKFGFSICDSKLS
jgi:isoleucyl-tRNA synthetase